MDARDKYPALATDLAIAKEVLDPAFERADAKALSFQTRFRSSELVLIFGAVTAVALGALAAATSLQIDEAAANGWAITEAILTFALSALAFSVRKFRWHERWLRQRTLAETLRGEQFLFLGRTGSYAKAEDLKRALEIRLLEIERPGVNSDV